MQYRQPRGRYPPGTERRQPSLPSDYLQGGYFNKDGNVLPEVIQQWPEQLARAFLREGLKSTQLRRFFNRARAIEQQNLPFERLREDILSLNPHADGQADLGLKYYIE